MDLVTTDVRKFKWMIDGYAKEFTNKRISVDIIELISIYYGKLYQKAFIMVMQQHSRSSKIMKLLDIYSKTEYPINLYFTSKQNGFGQLNNYKQTNTISHQCALPTAIKLICKEKYGNKITSDVLFSSDRWNLIFRMGPIMNVTALHPQFCQNQWSMSMSSTETEFKYFGYNLNLPTPKIYSASQCVYSQKDQKLYKPEGAVIRLLDLSKKHNKISDWKWEIWKDHIDICPQIHMGASFCMVDNDRFMAIMNANGKKSYLFAMNDTKLGIPLADACENRWKSQSIYHKMHHKIITVGGSNAEWYDLNKNKAMIIARYKDKYLNINNVWYSPFDPNVLYSTADCSYGYYSHTQGMCLVAIDLRSGECTKHHIEDLRKPVYNESHWHHMYMRW